DHEGGGGDGETDGELPVGNREREGLRGEVPEVVSDEGCIHALGDSPAAAAVPGKGAGLGADVRLR
ncbi:unnamed protein product, partial [Linum tenue]